MKDFNFSEIYSLISSKFNVKFIFTLKNIFQKRKKSISKNKFCERYYQNNSFNSIYLIIFKNVVFIYL